jgi:long-chain acyl-CoA synthetase
MVEFFGLAAGTVTAFARTIDTLSEDLASSHPNLVPAVPRIYEKVYGRVQAARESGGAAKRLLFDWAVGVGRERSRYEQERRPVPVLVRLQAELAHRLVFARIHALLGGNIKYMMSGGAPLARELAEFFHAVGLPILEGYGLTETTPCLTVNRPDRFKLGTVGLPLSCCEVRIADDGEILARGTNIAQGYYHRPEATAEAWDPDGWFHTGDIGEFDADGFLRITDRKKDLIKTSGGKYIAPQALEGALKTMTDLVSQVVVIGDRRKFVSVLVTVSEDQAKKVAAAAGEPAGSYAEAARSKAVRAKVQAAVDQLNSTLPSYETIKRLTVLDRDLTQEAGDLTPTLKVKRKMVTQKYQAQIDAMYDGESLD